ncbi:MAG: hypothetical protein K1X78_19020 [Verrucomicrobiaceae bacterium]|nr:hypothetical protein [Verrucomicrobiaceae bacterium]
MNDEINDAPLLLEAQKKLLLEISGGRMATPNDGELYAKRRERIRSLLSTHDINEPIPFDLFQWNVRCNNEQGLSSEQSRLRYLNELIEPVLKRIASLENKSQRSSVSVEVAESATSPTLRSTNHAASDEKGASNASSLTTKQPETFEEMVIGLIGKGTLGRIAVVVALTAVLLFAVWSSLPDSIKEKLLAPFIERVEIKKETSGTPTTDTPTTSVPVPATSSSR